MCGENFWQQAWEQSLPGSSPRVRGKPACLRPGPGLAGLIPACAGKTFQPLLRDARSQAHPRVCGENLLACGQGQASQGSSPRVRGKHSSRYCGMLVRRLIPACAGKTACSDPGGWRVRAHPRVCGENPVFSLAASAAVGSSPRVRGKRSRKPSELASRRLIPACAGKTGRAAKNTGLAKAHPRVCGENIALAVDD